MGYFVTRGKIDQETIEKLTGFSRSTISRNIQQMLNDGRFITNKREFRKSQDYSLAVATNAYRGSTIESLNHVGIYHYFDTIACYDDVPLGKPHPDMLYKILNELTISADKSMFVGDGPRDEVASKRANIPYVMVDWGFTDHLNAVRSVEELKNILLNSLGSKSYSPI